MSKSSQAVPDAACPLRAVGLSKTFRQGASVVHALRDVSFSVPAGKFVAVMGASGSGKSTLLHVMAGLTTPTSGTVEVDGQNLSKMSDGQLTRFRRRRIGLVFQAFNLIPSLTAEDNVKLPLLTEGRHAEANKMATGLLDRLGLSERKSHRPDALSGGEQQRVAIARALVTNPAIVLADEPTGSLDSVTGQSICKLLRELCQEEGRTIVIVTHEPAVAAWAERVVIMKDGNIIDESELESTGDANSLASHYQRVVSAAN